MFKITFFVLLGAGLLLVLGYVLQPAIIYFPQQELEASPADLGLEYEDVWLQSAGEKKIHGWFVPGPTGNHGPAVLFLHGNAGNVSHRMDLLRIVQELGLACLLIDYQGYGQSQGKPSEQNMYEDARVSWNFLLQEKGLQPEQVVVWGHSLGGPVAANLAREQNPGALILDSTFTSLPEMGQKLYYVLPVKWIARFDYPTQEYVAQSQAPVLVVHSPDDELVPFEMGRQLYAAASGTKEFLEVQGGHDDGYITAFDIYTEGIADFLTRETQVSAEQP